MRSARSLSVQPWDALMASRARSNATLRAGGALRDVAPTLLDLLGLPQPVEMTGQTLFNPVPNPAG